MQWAPLDVGGYAHDVMGALSGVSGIIGEATDQPLTHIPGF